MAASTVSSEVNFLNFYPLSDVAANIFGHVHVIFTLSCYDILITKSCSHQLHDIESNRFSAFRRFLLVYLDGGKPGSSLLQLFVVLYATDLIQCQWFVTVR